MRNRVNDVPKRRTEDEFVDAGTAIPSQVKASAKARTKSKPVTVSLTDAYLNQIVTHLQHAASEGEVTLTRTHVIKAGLLALGELSPDKVMALMRKA
ncbi:hypothetical protein FR773_25830 (plasmid) [Leclercia adecarboxylata]|uniref:hypothetical protein n=1 Tax=Leclercia adecarboxylata TaxID=83655 RepID=UPI0012A8E970|nr:hypothetical protein [Leclercia adecarboxylata]QFH68059.1 hypothetical protein FR773_25830 [Leclercia adecarboxylata]